MARQVAAVLTTITGLTPQSPQGPRNHKEDSKISAIGGPWILRGLWSEESEEQCSLLASSSSPQDSDLGPVGMGSPHGPATLPPTLRAEALFSSRVTPTLLVA